MMPSVPRLNMWWGGKITFITTHLPIWLTLHTITMTAGTVVGVNSLTESNQLGARYICASLFEVVPENRTVV